MYIHNYIMIVICPHCCLLIYIEQINCGIFRHAIYRDSYEQIDPHASKEQCEKLINDNMILGCCKPFKISINENNILVEKCDYI